MPYTTTAELREAFQIQADSAGLKVECAMGGTMHAHVAVIAEAPGRMEVAQNVPLVGGAGSIFWKALREHVPTLARHDCYVTNVVKRQVSFEQETGDRKPAGKHEVSAWQHLLLWELEQLPNLQMVILLGNYAIEAVTGNTGVNKWRGSVLLNIPIGNRTVTAVCMHNPAFCVREPLTHITFNMDMAHKVKPVFLGTYKQHNVRTIINPSAADALDFIRMTENAREPIASDIEVISNETACVGLAPSVHDAVCIAFRREAENIYSEGDELRIRLALQRLYTNPKVRVIWQNGAFDMGWLWFKDRIRTAPAYGDTMLAHHVLYPQLPHNLGFIVAQYTNHPYYKDEKDTWKHTGSVDKFWEYNGKDCALTLLAHAKMMAEMRSQGLDRFYLEHVMRLQPHLVRMQVGGVAVDIGLKEKLSDALKSDVESKLAAFHAAVQEATGDPTYAPNPASPKQMSELYFSRLRLVGRGTSTDATNRELMFKHPRTPEAARRVIRAVDAWAEDNKFYTTYVTMQPDYDDRMRCTYNQTGVRSAPGRLSSSQTLWGSGGNLQNIPDRAKEMFIADNDADDPLVFIYIDGAQAEARVVGWRYNIRTWIDQFERARLDGIYDAHRALAADMFHVPYDEVPTFDRYALTEADAAIAGIPFVPDKAGQTTMRFVAKRCRHGLNYRMMPDRLSLATGLPIREANDAFFRYHRTTPQVKRGWGADERLIKETRMLYNAYGRRYVQLEPITEESTKSIVAFYHQSTIGDHVCRVIYKAHDDPKWPRGKARIALNTHDGLIGLARRSVAKDALRIMVKHAEQPVLIESYLDEKGEFLKRPHRHELIIPADAAMSIPDKDGVHRWSTIKKIKRKELM